MAIKAVSAPGKVLLAGGYLVLDRAYTGVVFGLSARIHAIVQPISTQKGVSLSEIVVRSPQFTEAIWEYGYRWSEDDGGMSVTQLRANAHRKLNPNPFVEATIAYALTYVACVSSPQLAPVSITVLADDDYYSSPADLTSDIPGRFHYFGIPLPKAHKTGLGSSAALVTALTAAVLTHYLPDFDLSASQAKQQLHNLAQAAHCAAQGKVGSGFDVASAVYGSCVYRRFSPSILSATPGVGQPGFAISITDLVQSDTWDTEVLRDAVRVPAGLRLVMCDVSCGSQTPGMVKQVLAWRNEKPEEANAIWANLDAANGDLVNELRAVAEGQGDDLDRLSTYFARVRSAIRLMSEKSGVPIEPPSQTALIDACEAIPGVIGGVVPGAGGFDAIALLIKDDTETVSKLQELFSTWRFESEREGGKVCMLSVKQEMQGVRTEDVSPYRQWLP